MYIFKADKICGFVKRMMMIVHYKSAEMVSFFAHTLLSHVWVYVCVYATTYYANEVYFLQTAGVDSWQDLNFKYLYPATSAMIEKNTVVFVKCYVALLSCVAK